jgi:fibronectin type 3 domain-containing protein
MVDMDVKLTWEPTPPAEPDLLGYNVYRSRVSGADYEQLNYAPVLNTFYRDDEAAGGIFYYVVTTIDTGGNESDYSYELLVDKR